MSSGNVLVAGAGIGGLAVANGLARAGWKVRVLEKSPGHQPVGAGIILAANAVQSLQQLGVDVTPEGHPLPRMEVTDERGAVLQQSALAEWSADWGPTLGVHRQRLHHALARALPEGVEVVHQQGVKHLVETPDGVEVTELDGKTRRFDALVGADGIHSQVRALLLGGRNGALRYSGYTCWRTVCANPGLDAAVEMWGRGARVGLVPLKEGELYVFLVRNAPKGAATLDFPDGLRAAFSRFGGAWPSVMANLKGDAILHHDLQDQPDLQWGRGRVWLLGDAAHSMLPNQGQGAAMAIEDALVATRLFAAAGANVPAQHAEYVRQRGPRVARVHRDSYNFGVVAQWENALAVWMRNTAVRLVPSGMGNRALRGVVEPGIRLVRGAA